MIRDSRTSPSISQSKSQRLNHRIYTGSFQSLESCWIDTIAGLQTPDPLLEINVLVGSNVLASYLRRRLAGTGRTAANVRFHTFLDLANHLAVGREKTGLPRTGAAVIVENLLAEDTPPAYAQLSGYRGFRDALLDTFRDLRDAGITPDQLERATGQAKDPERRQHLSDFTRIYRRYREVAAHLHDVDDDFRAAIGGAAHAAKNHGLRQLLVYGIYDVTGQQSRLLTVLKDWIDLIYFIPFVHESVSDFARPFVESRSRELGIEPISLQDPAPGSMLGILAAGAFGFDAESVGRGNPGSDGSLSLVSVPGESRAAVEIVREIFRAVRDGTIRGFHEAAVILRQPESDIPILAEAFRLRGVPCFIHGGRSFAERPLARAVIAVAGLEGRSFSREAILSAMELVAAALPENSTFKWDVQVWRALTNDPRFLAGLDSWDSGTKGLIDKARSELETAESRSGEIEDEDSGNVLPVAVARWRLATATLLRDAWLLLRQASADWPASLPWRDWAALFEQRLIPLLGNSEEWPAFSAVLDELAGLEALRGLAGSLIWSAVSADRFRSALLESIASRSNPVGRFQRNGVNVLSTSAARGLRFPLVIIPGLDEGRFPAKLRQDPLLLDNERSSIEMLPLKSKRVDEEKLLFDMAARSAERRLVLMTSRLDESSDRERIPSQFFLRVASAIRGGTVSIRDLNEAVVPGFRSVSLDHPAPENREVAVDEGEIRLRIIAAERESAGRVLRVLAQLEPLRFKRPLQFDQARWMKKLTPFDGFISDPSLVRWTAERVGISAGQVSASRLEEYAKCPYSFFLKRVMNLRAWEEREKVEGMDPLDRGLVIHSVLEKFLRASGDAAFDPGRTRIGELELQARELLEAAKPAGLAELLWEIERDALLDMLQGWLEFEAGRANSGLCVAELELAFGEFTPKEKYPAFRVRAGRHNFDFRGRIDRVDLSRDRKRARVTDYKTGMLPDTMAKKTRTPLMSGEKIQVVVYAGALSVLDEFSGVETIEGEYLHLQPRDGLTLSCSFSHEELCRASEMLPGLLQAMGDGIDNGVFFARTSGRVRPSGHCEYCDYLPLCGKDRIRTGERKANDPAVKKFLQTVEPL